MKKILYLLLAVFFGCSLTLVSSCDNDEDDEVTFSDATIEVGENYKISNGSGTQWTSDNELIATVSGTTVTGICAGTTEIRSSSLGAFNITVEPAYTLYPEPYLKWGASASAIKAAMSKYTLYSEDTEDLVYSNVGIIAVVDYALENNKLDYVGLAIPLESAEAEDLVTHLSNRYIYIDSEDDYSYMIDPTEETFVIVTAMAISDTPMWMIVYEPYEEDTKAVSTPHIPAHLFGNLPMIPCADRTLIQKFESLLK